MSTDFQRYSLENQAAGIAAFAASRNLTFVRTYQDKGRSGLRFSNRQGLQSLIDGVEGRRADFDFILVYDVSRWGRFCGGPRRSTLTELVTWLDAVQREIPACGQLSARNIRRRLKLSGCG